jgi:hypothetical protein
MANFKKTVNSIRAKQYKKMYHELRTDGRMEHKQAFNLTPKYVARENAGRSGSGVTKYQD